MTYEYDELIDIPSYTATRNLRVVTLEFRFLMRCLCTEILLGPYLAMKFRIVDERKPFFGPLLSH